MPDANGAGTAVEETRIVTKRLRDRPDDSWTIDGALASGGYEVAAFGARQGRCRRRAGAGEAVGPAGPGRRGLPDRAEVVVPAARLVPALPRGERRRRRAVDVQGPHAPRARSAPARRGHRDRVVRGAVQRRLRLRARRVRARLRTPDARDRRRPGQGLPRQEHPRLRVRLRHRRAPRRGRVHLRRGDRAARVARRRARHAAHPAAVPRDRRPVREADRRQQRRDAVDGAAHHADGRRGVRQARRQPLHRARASSRCPVT